MTAPFGLKQATFEYEPFAPSGLPKTTLCPGTKTEKFSNKALLFLYQASSPPAHFIPIRFGALSFSCEISSKLSNTFACGGLYKMRYLSSTTSCIPIIKFKDSRLVGGHQSGSII